MMFFRFEMLIAAVTSAQDEVLLVVVICTRLEYSFIGRIAGSRR
jgi:hypothetical protein